MKKNIVLMFLTAGVSMIGFAIPTFIDGNIEAGFVKLGWATIFLLAAWAVSLKNRRNTSN